MRLLPAPGTPAPRIVAEPTDPGWGSSLDVRLASVKSAEANPAPTTNSIPLTGWLTQQIGQIRLFVGAILMFVFASWLCGIAPDPPFLLGARVLQGLVAGPLIPLSQAVLLSSYPRARANMALALWAMTATVGPIAGPVPGGWITDNYSWS